VHPPYAIPDQRLRLRAVTDRLYRGPCRSDAEFNQVLERFRARKADVLALYDSLPDLQPGYRKQARNYLEDFYSAIEPNRVKRTLVDNCQRTPGI
jgi:hypothetical protein